MVGSSPGDSAQLLDHREDAADPVQPGDDKQTRQLKRSHFVESIRVFTKDGIFDLYLTSYGSKHQELFNPHNLLPTDFF